MPRICIPYQASSVDPTLAPTAGLARVDGGSTKRARRRCRLPVDDRTLGAPGQRPGPIGYLSVVTNTYRLPDGSVADWDILAVPDSVAVLALTGDNQVVLARQYRPGPDAVLDELPGGMIDAGESPRDAAVRELREETGYRGDVSIVGYTFVVANSTRRSWVSIATGCGQVAHPQDRAVRVL